MTHKEFEKFILSFPEVWLDYPFGEGTAVYKFGKDNDGAGKIVALVAEGTSPLRVSLKCDPLLAQNLRDKYESVLPGYHLNKKHWNTVVFESDVKRKAIVEMIVHSYKCIVGKMTKATREMLLTKLEDQMEFIK